MTNGHYTIRRFGPEYNTVAGITAKSLGAAEKIAREIGTENCDVRFVRNLDGASSPAFRIAAK